MSKHAYLIMADRDFVYLKYLLSLIDDKRNDLYIHIDKKVSKNDFDFLNNYVDKSQMYFIPRESVNWGGISMMKCELSLFRRAYESNQHYEYFHLLSAKDLPLYSQDYIHNFMDNLNRGKEFVEIIPKEEYPSSVIKTRIKLYHLFPEISFKSFSKKFFSKLWTGYRLCERKIQSIFHVDMLKKYGIDFGYGSQWISIDRELVNFMLQKENNLKEVFKHSEVPDEFFIQTLIVNSPYFLEKLYYFPGSQKSTNLRVINWEYGRPYVWQSEHLDLLLESRKRGYLFSRKFDVSVDSFPLKKVEALIKEESMENL